MVFSGAGMGGALAGGMVIASMAVQLVWNPSQGWLRFVQVVLLVVAGVAALASWSAWQRSRADAQYDAALDAEEAQLRERLVTTRSHPVTPIRSVPLDGVAPASTRARWAWGSLGAWGVAGAVGVTVGGGIWVADAAQSDLRPEPQSPLPTVRPVVPTVVTTPSPVSRRDPVRPATTPGGGGREPSTASVVPRPRERGDPPRVGHTPAIATPPPGSVTDVPTQRQRDGQRPRPAKTPAVEDPVQPPPPPPPPTPVPTPRASPPAYPSQPETRPKQQGCKIKVKTGGVKVDGCVGIEIELGAP